MICRLVLIVKALASRGSCCEDFARNKMILEETTAKSNHITSVFKNSTYFSRNEPNGLLPSFFCLSTVSTTLLEDSRLRIIYGIIRPYDMLIINTQNYLQLNFAIFVIHYPIPIQNPYSRVTEP